MAAEQKDRQQLDAQQRWTLLSGLDAVHATDGDRPKIESAGRVSGANVVHLSFTAGQVMDEHRAGWPILVIGQSGLIEFTVDGETIELKPGAAVHVAAGVTHRLLARADSAATLVVLNGKQ